MRHKFVHDYLGVVVSGDLPNWQEMANRFATGPMKAALDASRKAAAVHERTFLQETPQGDLVIVTLETLDGGDPMAAFGKMMADPTMAEFSAWAADVHGIDPKSPPPAVPRLVYDSKA
jgi:hypothetical protein